ncbi:PhnD/SsuA/transferrin family substrate-binding protein [Kibdelosporangium lantanae]|uniref:PhnD/SsuA/transferrin family substrate-binding protein n=1 Tax=Kibdelosporangium lantanae TaxID=1497396 RepID=A0ABW3M3X1_9PSEU
MDCPGGDIRELLFIAVLLAHTLTGCGLLGGDKTDAGANNQVEKSTITVAVLPTVETAPLQLGIRSGYFKGLGLDVKAAVATSGQATVTGMINGQYDIVYSSYPPIIAAQAKKIADLRVLAGNSFATPKTAVVVTSPHSPLSSIRDLTGRTVAVTARGTLSDLMVKSTFATNGGDPNLAALRRIVGNARRAYWLNPEPERLWGTGDSLAPDYAHVVEMYECRTVHQLSELITRLLPI